MTAYVSFSSKITQATSENLISIFADQANNGGIEVCLLISTPGGSVTFGINLYNLLRAFPFRLVTHNVGVVGSVGTAVFLAGEERYASPHSKFDFTSGGIDFEGKDLRQERGVREHLRSILGAQAKIGEIVDEQTKLDESQIGNIFREAT